ncbi:MAG: aminotransferase class I/II-fold pyridoxal phosphate-dependent enzyme [Candidatus Odinarchaeota archaeon]
MKFDILKKTPLYEVLSDRGRRINLPEGIFYWAGRAKKEAEYKGTIGAAYAYEKDFLGGNSIRWVPCYLEYVNDYFNNLDINDLVPYASISGLDELRTIWKEWIMKKSFFKIDTEKEKLQKLDKYTSLPIITSGVTNAIFMSSAMLLNPSESIICPNKRWGNYDNIFSKFLGANIQSFDFFVDNKLNLEGIKEAIYKVVETQNKVILILGFPNNPTGYIPTWEENAGLIQILKETQKEIHQPLVILIDDAYEPYVFSKNVVNRSLFYDIQQLDENIIPIKLDGITKELLLYGGRIGFVTIGLKSKWVNNDKELEILKSEIDNKLSGFNRSTISNCNHFYQAVTTKIFKEKGMDRIIKIRSSIQEILKLRFEKINSELKKIKNPNISVDPNGGGFFVFLNLNPNKIKATTFADHMLKKYKVGVIPIENINENINGIRIAYCSIDINQIPEIINRINLALNDFN